MTAYVVLARRAAAPGPDDRPGARRTLWRAPPHWRRPIDRMLPWPPLIHVHFFARGYPFAWVICGPGPAPARPPARLLVLGMAVAVHVSMSPVIYAGGFPAGVGPVDRRRGATLMYLRRRSRRTGPRRSSS